MDYVRELATQHVSGRRDHSAPLWSLMMFEAFLRDVLPATPARPALSSMSPAAKAAERPHGHTVLAPSP
jgi:hypothetical protein